MVVATTGAAADAVATRTIELLAPLYTEVCGRDAALDATVELPVELQRTNDDWLKLVFPSCEVEKDVACVNSHDGCRCNYVRLLRAVMALVKRKLLRLDARYVVRPSPDEKAANPRVATLQLHVRLRSHADKRESLQGFDFVLCHLQGSALSIVKRSERSRKEAAATALLDATCSSCHVVGCRLHSWEADATLGKHPTLTLPDVFQSLMTHMEAERMEVRDDATYVARMTRPDTQVVLTDLPTNVLQNVVCFMDARGLAALSGACSLFRNMAYEVVPGLNLVLYEHQRRGLKWMLHRETPSLVGRPTPHPFLLPHRCKRSSNLAIDLINGKMVEDADMTMRDLCGGMFCDEPGLGKTITMLALILRTKGQTTRHAHPGSDSAHGDAPAVGLRSAPSRDRSVRPEDLVSSGASLIVVPDPLVEHWKYQIEAHVAPGALQTFVDDDDKAELPINHELAEYDVVVTSFSRLAQEWKLHRPASVLEERMPERYGFENQPHRYTDGTIRGEVSSLLTVHWVRVIVDEGHKLGGQTPSNLMLMARLLSAQRRWVMTGTPTPNTLQSADLRYMHGLLVFLRNLPYGKPDGKAWAKAIARPFEQNELVSYYRLQNLLSRIMMRHTKESIREILPEPVRQTVYIDPTPSEYAQYNVVAAAVRINLVLTNDDPHTPGKLHADSLLNPVNRKEALRVIANLRFACCGGVNSEVVLTDKARAETLAMLRNFKADAECMEAVSEYLLRLQMPGMTTECEVCERQLKLLLILPCGHMCCPDCTEDQSKTVGPHCFRCKAEYDYEDMQRLQPGIEFREIDETNDVHPRNRNNRRRGGHTRNPERQGGGGRERHAQRQEQGAQPTASEETLGRNRHYWAVDASKVFYAATRIRELKDEFARVNVAPNGSRSSSRRQPRYVKAIIFSQFTEIIWRTRLAFEQHNLRTANFITRISPKRRMQQLKRFRTDPSLNVLLLSEMGSHGLDLSFVTHIFLMEEIWDKSLEQQVVSRAHRMGASQAVVVEQLWMRGSVESHMTKVVELGQRQEQQEEEERAELELTPSSPSLAPAAEAALSSQSRKRRRSNSNKLLNVAGKKKRKRNRSEPGKAAGGNKNSFLQRKLDYVLNNLRLLGENVVAEPGQVRFFVVDGNENVTRQAVHFITSPGARAVTSSIGTSPTSDQGASGERRIAAATTTEPRRAQSSPANKRTATATSQSPQTTPPAQASTSSLAVSTKRPPPAPRSVPSPTAKRAALAADQAPRPALAAHAASSTATKSSPGKVPTPQATPPAQLKVSSTTTRRVTFAAIPTQATPSSKASSAVPAQTVPSAQAVPSGKASTKIPTAEQPPSTSPSTSSMSKPTVKSRQSRTTSPAQSPTSDTAKNCEVPAAAAPKPTTLTAPRKVTTARKSWRATIPSTTCRLPPPCSERVRNPRSPEVIVIDDDDDEPSFSAPSPPRVPSRVVRKNRVGPPPKAGKRARAGPPLAVIVVDSSSSSEESLYVDSGSKVSSSGGGDSDALGYVDKPSGAGEPIPIDDLFGSDSSDGGGSGADADASDGSDEDDEDAEITAMALVAKRRWEQRLAFLHDLSSSDDDEQHESGVQAEDVQSENGDSEEVQLESMQFDTSDDNDQQKSPAPPSLNSESFQPESKVPEESKPLQPESVESLPEKLEAPESETEESGPPQLEPLQLDAPQTEQPQSESPQLEPPQSDSLPTKPPQLETVESEPEELGSPQSEPQQSESPRLESPQRESPQVGSPQPGQEESEPSQEKPPQLAAPQPPSSHSTTTKMGANDGEILQVKLEPMQSQLAPYSYIDDEETETESE